MTDEGILNTLSRSLCDLLPDNSIVQSMENRREGGPNWHSFNYINFIVAVEIEFGVKFKVADIGSFETAGGIVAETSVDGSSLKPRRLGMKRFIADYIATPKNGVISELYPSLGFAAVSEPEVTKGATRWLLNLADYATHQSHIVRAGVGA
jgi:acyl carrier protein